MPTYSIIFPHAPVQLPDLRRYAQLVADGSAARLWQGQTVVADPHVSFGALVGAGLRIPVGTAVTLMPQRHPMEAALQARSLAALSGQPVVAGFGPGGREFQRRFLPAPYRSVTSASREYLRAVRSLLDGEHFGHGTYVDADHPLGPLPGPHVDVGLGVLRERMAEVAGEVADVAITWLTPPAYLEQVIVPALDEGAARAGRPRPRLVTMVPVVLAAAGRDAERYVMAGNGAHLLQPHYHRMLERAGVPLPGQPQGSSDALIEAGVFVYGSEREIVSRLAAYADAGVDEIVLNLAAVSQLDGESAAVEDLSVLLGLLTGQGQAVSPNR